MRAAASINSGVTPHIATGGLALLLIAVAVIDARTLRIPDWLNAIVVLSGLVVTYLLDRELLDAFMGVAVGYAALWLVNTLFRAIRRRDGLGLGDAKLLAGAGAWLGWEKLPFVVLAASILGLAYVGLDRLRGRAFDGGRKLPFGPYLCLGFFAMWVGEMYF